MPRVSARRRLVCLTVRETHELKLHAPRTQEVHPVLSLRSLHARRWCAHDLDVVRAQVGDRRIHVLHIECKMVPSDVAVAWLWALTVGRFVLKDLVVTSVAHPI